MNLKQKLDNIFFTWFYTKYSKNLGLPIIFRKRWGTEWVMFDRYGKRFLLRETGNYEGSPLIITLEDNG